MSNKYELMARLAAASEQFSPATRLVGNAILSRANDEGKAWPSFSTIAKDAGVGRATVARSIKALLAAGLFIQGERSIRGSNGQKYQVTEYTLVMGWQPGASVSPAVSASVSASVSPAVSSPIEASSSGLIQETSGIIDDEQRSHLGDQRSHPVDHRSHPEHQRSHPVTAEIAANPGAGPVTGQLGEGETTVKLQELLRELLREHLREFFRDEIRELVREEVERLVGEMADCVDDEPMLPTGLVEPMDTADSSRAVAPARVVDTANLITPAQSAHVRHDPALDGLRATMFAAARSAEEVAVSEAARIASIQEREARLQARIERERRPA